MSDQQAKPLEPWRQAILKDAHKFAMDCQQEFYGRIGMSFQHCPESSARPEVIATYCNVLLGIGVQASIASADESLEFEEHVVAQVREHFKNIRSAIFKSKVLGQGPQLPPVPPQGRIF